MRANIENKSVDMEVRDINYILPAYIFNYLYVSKNEDPDKIVFPMIPSVPHPRKPGVMIPIQWISITDPLAIDIAEDGKDIPEITPVQEAVLDTKDKTATDDGGGGVVGGSQPHSSEEETSSEEDTAKAAEVKVSPAKAALGRSQMDRAPKMPEGGDIGPGARPDNMGSRDIKLNRQIVVDLKDEADIDESAEKPAEIEKPKE